MNRHALNAPFLFARFDFALRENLDHLPPIARAINTNNVTTKKPTALMRYAASSSACCL
jgi:hypothetical protein